MLLRARQSRSGCNPRIPRAGSLSSWVGQTGAFGKRYRLPVTRLHRRQVMKSEICMPYIRVKDACASLEFYERCLGFRKVSEHRFAPGLPLCIGIERGELHFLLTEHT